MTAPIKLSFPFRLDAKAGQNGRGGTWRVKASKVERQREVVRRHWLTIATAAKGLALPLYIHMVRVAPTLMDDDGVVGCFKAMRDEVASRLGFDDRTPLVFWLYTQRKGQARRPARKGIPAQPAEWGVEIILKPAFCVACGESLASGQTIKTSFGLLCADCPLPGALGEVP